MKVHKLFLFLSSCFFCLEVMAEPTKRNPAQQFTILAIVSSLVIVGLWVMIWIRRKKEK
jgi:prolipoprotein diacylglyceryltransferase